MDMLPTSWMRSVMSKQLFDVWYVESDFDLVKMCDSDCSVPGVSWERIVILHRRLQLSGSQ